MSLNAYQVAASRTMGSDDRDMAPRDALARWGLGVAGEAGEVADYLKKHLFHGHEMDRNKLIKEMGDVLWYLAATCTTMGIDFQDVADQNIRKLNARYPDGFSHAASRARQDQDEVSRGAA